MNSFDITNSAFGITTDSVTPSARNYKLGTWPPKDDFPVVLDRSGRVVSRFSDSIWRLWPWCDQTLILNFLDEPHRNRPASITKENAKILRLVALWLIYGPDPIRCATSLVRKLESLKGLFRIASREKIFIGDMSKYPKVIETCAKELSARYSSAIIYLLHHLYHDSDSVGFTIMDDAAIRKFSSLLPSFQDCQTAYIPPRIWDYQATRMEEFISDFLKHKNALVECFSFCLKVYTQYYGSLEAACTSQKRGERKSSPFSSNKQPDKPDYLGRFSEVARRHGIAELLQKWVVPEGESIDGAGRGIITLSKYFSMANASCLAYILNFSLMRISEAWSLRVDCLEIEDDDLIGKIYILKGVTTKTIADDDARWITLPGAVRAIEVATCVGTLRSQCEKSNTKIIDGASSGANQFLFVRSQEPWAGMSLQIRGVRHSPPSYNTFLDYFPKLLSASELIVSKKDMEIAKLITPNLNTDRIREGDIWPLAWHQLRRTGAVNMQASGLVSDSSIQYQLKHRTRAMSRYYGKGYSQLRLSQSARTQYIQTMYETLAMELQTVQSSRFISPYGSERKNQILRTVSESDHRKLMDAAKKGQVSWRPTLLGGCTYTGICEYGGVDNIARCCGGDGKGPCPDILIDRSKKVKIIEYIEVVDQRISSALENSPYKQALHAQKISAENALKLIKTVEE